MKIEQYRLSGLIKGNTVIIHVPKVHQAPWWQRAPCHYFGHITWMFHIGYANYGSSRITPRYKLLLQKHQKKLILQQFNSFVVVLV